MTIENFGCPILGIARGLTAHSSLALQNNRPKSGPFRRSSFLGEGEDSNLNLPYFPNAAIILRSGKKDVFPYNY